MTDTGKIAALSRAEKQRLAEELLRQRAARERGHEHEHTLPLSLGQQSLWVVHQMDPANTAFNITTLAAVHGPLDADALHRAFQGVVDRHPLLRTTYHDADGRPVQRIHAHQAIDLKLIDTASWGQDRLAAWQADEAERPFDLRQGPLLRLTVLTRSRGEHLLFFVAHHIAVDFASLQIIFNDLRTLYEAAIGNPGSAPRPLPAHYRAYIERQHEMLASAEGEELWAYWREKLAGDLPTLELPTDFPRPPAQSLAGATLHFDLGEELTTRLRALARREGATLYNTVLAAFFTLLHRYTGQDDLIIGSPMVGRSEPEFQQVVGYFVNPVPLRASLAGDPTFRELLRQVRRASVEALAHHRLPFPVLVQRLQPVRDPSRPPIFQVAMNWNQTRALEREGASPNSDRSPENGNHDGRLEYEVLRGEQRGAPLDLSLMLSEGSRSISGYLQYATSLFRVDTIERMAGHLRMLLDAVAADADMRVSELPILTEPERHQILIEWNDTEVAYPAGETLPGLFERQAARTPEATALIFNGARMTYAELDGRASRLASRLRRQGIEPGALVGVYLERSPEMVVALLAILKAGGAYLPLDPNYPTERLAYMLADAQAPIVITQSWLRDRLPNHDAETIYVDVEGATLSDEEPAGPSAARPEAPAYVIYTSGTTGGPKGVVVTHRAVLNTLHWLQDQFALSAADVIAQKTSLSFTDSVWEIFWPLITGAQLALIDDVAVRDPSLLYEQLRDYAVTYTQFVPPVMMSFLETVEALAPSDPLPRLKWIFNGGEALPPAAASTWYAVFPHARIANIYGMTESAIYATCAIVEPPAPGQPAEVLVGKPIANARAYLLDRHLQVVPIGVVGEIHIGGVGLAEGYLQRPELTAEKFIPNPFVPGERLYKTGDLGRWLPDGAIEYLGRVDHQVQIRGFRVELGEVEAALGQQASVREAVVVAREDRSGARRLIGYVTADTGSAPQGAELRRALGGRLPDYMVPSLIVVLDHLPLTPNGKVDRQALPLPTDDRAGLGSDAGAPRDALEAELAAIWAEVLGLSAVGIHDNFFDLGGHSLLATQVVARLRANLNVEMPLRRLFEHPTIAGLADSIRAANADAPEDAVPSIPPVRRDDTLPLSFAQERLWFLDQLDPHSPVYAIPAAIRVRGPLDQAALRRSLDMVVERHETLRTRFPSVDGRARQVIAESVVVPLLIDDLSLLPEPERLKEAQRQARKAAREPFDLASGPLLRLHVWRLADADHLLLLSMHHIISDGWSSGVLVRELVAGYAAIQRGDALELPPLPIQYADYAVWQRDWLDSGVREAQLDYWTRQMSEAPALLELPTDYPRPAVAGRGGDRVPITLSPALTDRLARLSRETDATLYMTLLTAFQVLLARYSGQSDLVVGSPIANRTRPELEPLIGFFVNTLALRADLSGNPTFREAVARTKEMSLQAYAHQDLPFEVLVDALQPVRDLSHTPLFQAMFVLQNVQVDQPRLAGLSIAPVEVSNGTTMFDVTLALSETDEGLQGAVEYRTDLFRRSTMERFVEHFAVLLAGAVADPDQPIGQLPLLTPAERQQLVVEWNDTARDYPLDRTSSELLEEQVRRTPDAPALVFESHSLTYDELNRRANQLARYLRHLGVGPETIVVICVERSPDYILAIVAIAKAGAACLPLDLNLPAERLSFMLKDAAAPIVLTQEPLVGVLPPSSAQIVLLDRDWNTIAREDDANLGRVGGPENLAYVLYTSGSTGLPKGVLIENRSLTNYNLAAIDAMKRHASGRALQSYSVSFDPTVTEIWQTLLSGAALLQTREELIFSAPDLYELLRTLKITHFGASVAMLTVLPNHDLPDIDSIITGGDQVTWEVVQRWASGRIMVNGYGPTETTVSSSFYFCSVDDPGDPPIGRPVPNTQLYVLDQNRELVPIGVPGELYIGGAGVGRGYLNRPDLTAERFLPDPFKATSTPGARLYRTGDLVRYRPDGNLEFLGRIDTQVKIRGFRIELGEVETRLRQHPAVLNTVVTVQNEGAANKRLVAYLLLNEAVQPPTVAELRRFLLQTLPDYMAPSLFVVVDEFPRLPSGKLDRKALPAPETDRAMLADPYVAASTPAERALAQIWGDVLQVEQVGIHDNFFDLGGDSILAVQIIARANQAGLALSPRDLFQAQTVASLAEIAALAPYTTSAKAVVSGDVPLTPFQRRILAEPGAQAGRWQRDVWLEIARLDDPLLLRNAVGHLLAHHDALRTRFAFDGVAWRQEIPEAVGELPVEWVDLSQLDEARQQTAMDAKARETQLALSLSDAPLLRIVYFDLGQGRSGSLLLASHQLIMDEVSWQILLGDLRTALAHMQQGVAIELPARTTSFQDWARALAGFEASEQFEEDATYWLDALPTTGDALPLDGPGGPNVESSVHHVTVSLGEDETRSLLEEVPPVYHTTVVDALLTALAQTLVPWLGSPRIVVDLLGNGRAGLPAEMDLSRTIGCFTAAYPSVLEPPPAADPGEALKAIKEQLRQIPHEGLGYGLLHYSDRDAQRGADLRRRPAATIAFNFREAFDATSGEPVQRVAEGVPMHRDADEVRSHALEIGAAVADGRMSLTWRYSANLMQAATIERLAGDCLARLRELIAHCRSTEAGGFTPSDFPLAELDQQKLDQLLNRLSRPKGPRS